MAPNPAIMEAVEQLGYRVTVGDVATQAGFNVNLAQQGLLALATDVGGHLQVAETGEIVYLFPKKPTGGFAEQVFALAATRVVEKSLASIVLLDSYIFWSFITCFHCSNYCHHLCAFDCRQSKQR